MRESCCFREGRNGFHHLPGNEKMLQRGKFYCLANDEGESSHKQMVTDQAIMASEDMLKRALRQPEDEQEQQSRLNMILKSECLPNGLEHAAKLQFAVQTIHSLLQNCKRSIE